MYCNLPNKKEFAKAFAEVAEKVLACEFPGVKVTVDDSLGAFLFTLSDSAASYKMGYKILHKKYIESSCDFYDFVGNNISHVPEKLRAAFCTNDAVLRLSSLIKKGFHGLDMIMELIPVKGNEDYLARVVYHLFQDLAAIYKVTDDSVKGGDFTPYAVVSIELLNAWGSTEEELYAYACENIRNKNAFSCEDITCEMGNLTEEEREFFHSSGGVLPVIYDVKGVDNVRGTSALLFPEVFREIAKIAGEDLFLLPIFQNEIICLPYYKGVDEEDINSYMEMQNEFNRAGQEGYHNNMYLYNRLEDTVTLFREAHNPWEADKYDCGESMEGKDIIPQLIPIEGNESYLGTVPHRHYLDLAVIYHIIIDNDVALDDGSAIASGVVTDDVLKQWGVTEEELFAYACENTRQSHGIQCYEVDELLEMLGGDVIPVGLSARDVGLELYVFTNEKQIGGANALLFPDVFQKLSKEVGTNLYIVPSSIHDVICCPCYDSIDDGTIHFLKGMVDSVNNNEIPDDEILSYNLYYYNAEKNTISVI